MNNYKKNGSRGCFLFIVAVLGYAFLTVPVYAKKGKGRCDLKVPCQEIGDYLLEIPFITYEDCYGLGFQLAQGDSVKVRGNYYKMVKHQITKIRSLTKNLENVCQLSPKIPHIFYVFTLLAEGILPVADRLDRR